MSFQTILSRLSLHYDPREARAIAFAMLEDAFGVTRTDIYADKVRHFSEEEKDRLETILRDMERGIPMQYAIGQARFHGELFHVTPATLIPRPETEELVTWTVETARTLSKAASSSPDSSFRLLDVGTGSGCIAITLAHLLGSQWHVEAWDISAAALEVARGNALAHGVEVDFQEKDVLQEAAKASRARTYNIIVSNPPYVCVREKAEMEAHVLAHEPHQALFVPDENPLLFYRALSALSSRLLQPSGALLVETNCAYAQETAALFRNARWESSDWDARHAGTSPQVEVRCDAFGRERMVRALYD